jgi:hypothetical protein
MTGVPREELTALYGHAIEEYRFNVRLGWERTRYYLVLTTLIMGVATGLYSAGGDRVGTALTIVLFLLGAGVSAVGIRALTTSHTYYRAAVVHKATLERALGYNEPFAEGSGPYGTPAIGATPGQRQDKKILNDPSAWVGRPLRPGSIVAWLRALFVMLTVFHLVAAFAVAATLILWP